MRIHHLLISCILGLATLSAHAFERPFPANVKRGEMTPGNYPRIFINDKPRLLSPGARIWNESNTIDMPSSLRGTDIVVNYTENNDGDIDRVWILTKEEAKRLVPKPPAKPSTLPAPESKPVPLPTPQ